MLQSRLLRRVLGEAREKRAGALARGAAQHRVDEPVAGARACLCELDVVSDDRAVGRACQVHELVQPQSQRRQHGRDFALLDH